MYFTPAIDLGGRVKNPLEKTPFIIADVGSNWKRFERSDYNLELAFRHIDDARRCDCDAVKFQFFTHQELYGVDGPDDWALPFEWIPQLAARASVQGLEFMCTAFSPEGARLIDPYVRVHKVASSEIHHWPLIGALRATGKPIIFSTGGATLGEVEDLLLRAFNFETDALLDCVSIYPALERDYSFELLNLATNRLRPVEHFGLSDHTLGEVTAIAFAGAGATIFEKHFDALGDYGNSPATPDSPFSFGPKDLSHYCGAIARAITIVEGHTRHGANNEEQARHYYKRRLKVTKAVKSGDVLEMGVNFGLFRSLSSDLQAAPPNQLDEFNGKRLKRDKAPQDGLWFDDLE